MGTFFGVTWISIPPFLFSTSIVYPVPAARSALMAWRHRLIKPGLRNLIQRIFADHQTDPLLQEP
jgi:hypothetical protein